MTLLRRRVRGKKHETVQPALPLGHTDVRWDALPVAVREEVLARWCDLPSEVTAPRRVVPVEAACEPTMKGGRP